MGKAERVKLARHRKILKELAGDHSTILGLIGMTAVFTATLETAIHLSAVQLEAIGTHGRRIRSISQNKDEKRLQASFHNARELAERHRGKKDFDDFIVLADVLIVLKKERDIFVHAGVMRSEDGEFSLVNIRHSSDLDYHEAIGKLLILISGLTVYVQDAYALLANVEQRSIAVAEQMVKDSMRFRSEEKRMNIFGPYFAKPVEPGVAPSLDEM